MTDDMNTRPTIETILEAIRAVDQKLDRRIDALEQRFDALEQKVDRRIDGLEQRIDALERKVDERFEQVYTELDRVAIAAHSTKAGMHELRLAFREMQAQLKEALPVLQGP